MQKQRPDGSTRTVTFYVVTYRKIKVNGIWQMEHRYVMEQVLGRPLTSAELVHHKDGDGLNNHPDNLVILSKAEHTALHHTERRALRWSRNYSCCVGCGTTEKRYESLGMCTTCYGAYRYAQDPQRHQEHCKASQERHSTTRKAAAQVYAQTTQIPRHRERMQTDPEYRARHNEYKRQWYLRKKAAQAS